MSVINLIVVIVNNLKALEATCVNHISVGGNYIHCFLKYANSNKYTEMTACAVIKLTICIPVRVILSDNGVTLNISSINTSIYSVEMDARLHL